MPKQALFRTIKRWKRYLPRDQWRTVPRETRGLYVLYVHKAPDQYQVSYIGVAGLGRTGGGGIRGRLDGHNRSPGKGKWTHFSFFEVHDNVTRDEIRELEALLLGIFRHDQRVELSNKQVGSNRLSRLRRTAIWNV